MRIVTGLIAVSFMGSSFATLPPPTAEAKAQAAVAAAKAAWTDKIGQYQLCRATDRTAERYRNSLKASAKEVPVPVPTPACTDPGPFVPPIAEATRPLEASEAHSPPGTAVGPPSTNIPAAELAGGVKKK